MIVQIIAPGLKWPRRWGHMFYMEPREKLNKNILVWN